jgi:hypothetical protein
MVFTLGSTKPGVWASTTCWTNLIQHIRTPDGAASIRCRMFDFIPCMSCQLWLSLGSVILRAHIYETVFLGQSRWGKHSESSVVQLQIVDSLRRGLHVWGMTHVCLYISG